MGQNFLSREEAPWDARVWEILDRTATETARSFLSGRRLVQVEGPYGLGVQNVTGGEVEVEPGVSTGKAVPTFFLYESVKIFKRDLAAYERDGIMPPLESVTKAALDVARKEDDIIFNGRQGASGLLTAAESRRVGLSAWDQVGTAAGDITKAVNELDTAGLHGPYALALSPARYNLLFRLYAQGAMSELEHVRLMATSGVFKAPILSKGGVLIAANPGFNALILGQDLMLGFIGATPDAFELALSESFSLVIRMPGSICILEE